MGTYTLFAILRNVHNFCDFLLQTFTGCVKSSFNGIIVHFNVYIVFVSLIFNSMNLDVLSHISHDCNYIIRDL